MLSKTRFDQYTCWIFDMDGTLTIPQHDFDAIRKQLDIPMGADILAHIAMRPLEAQTQAKQTLFDWEHALAYSAKPDPDAANLLQLLSDKNIKMGVLTRNLTSLAHITLKAAGLDSFFSKNTILGRDIGVPKPDPDGIFRICKTLNQSPTQTVMVGDYIHDTQAGRLAGCLTILIDSLMNLGHPPCTDIRVQCLNELIGPLSDA